jgi:hypothetical protein
VSSFNPQCRRESNTLERSSPSVYAQSLLAPEPVPMPYLYTCRRVRIRQHVHNQKH